MRCALVMGDEEPECFICTETAPTPRKSACLCIDRFVHDSCLRKMLECKTCAKCPVCLSPYSNVTSSSRIVGVKWSSAGMCSMLLALVAVLLLTIASFTWYMASSDRDFTHFEQCFLLGAAMLMTVVGTGIVSILAHTFLVWGLGRLVGSAIVRQLEVRVETLENI